MKIKNVDPNDALRVLGAISGGFIGWSIADIQTGAVDSAKEAIEAVGDTAGSLIADAIQAKESIEDLFNPKSKSNVMLQKWKSAVGNTWITLSINWSQKYVEAVKKFRVNNGDSTELEEHLEKLKQYYDTKRNIEMYKFMNFYLERAVLAFFVRRYTVFENDPSTIQMINEAYTKTIDRIWPQDLPRPEDLNTQPFEENMRPTNISSYWDQITSSPLGKWIAEHPLHIGLAGMGVIIGEQVAEHPEVTSALVKALADVVPEEFKLEVA